MDELDPASTGCDKQPIPIHPPPSIIGVLLLDDGRSMFNEGDLDLGGLFTDDAIVD